MLFNPSANRQQDLARQAVICGELSGSDTCIAASITVVAYAPVLEMCRRLVAAGHDPAARLEAYRGAMLCLTVRSIGEAAGLEINGDGTGFRRRRVPDAAPPVRNSAFRRVS
jgi:hypothetical protein